VSTNRAGTFSKPPPLIRTNGSIEVPIWNGTPPVVSPKGQLSRHCHCSRGKTLKKRKQKVNTEEKLTLALDRNCLILLGKVPLRQIVIKLLKWLLTEMLEVRILPGEPTPFPLRI